jgi:hypothetical protein
VLEQLAHNLVAVEVQVVEEQTLTLMHQDLLAQELLAVY